MNALTEAPSSNAKHRSDDVVAYHFGDLSPEGRDDFEHHLLRCLGCRRALKTAGLLFAALPEALAPPKRRRTTDDLLQMMAAEEQRLRAEDRKAARASVRRAMHWAAPLVAAAAAAASVGPRAPAAQLVEWVAAKVSHREPPRAQIAAPPHPNPNAP